MPMMSVETPMLFFVASAVGLTLLVAVLLVWPLRRPERHQGRSLLALNALVFRERLEELARDREAGRIDAETAAALKTELERQMLDVSAKADRPHDATLGRGGVAGLVLLLGLLVAVAYRGLAWRPETGQWWQVQAHTGPVVEQLFSGQNPGQDVLAKQTLPDMVRVMQWRLQRQPSDVEGWYMLGMSYLQAELPDQAAEALDHAARLAPDRDDIALAYAQTLVFSERGQLNPRSRALLEQVLRRHPDHEGAMLLMGMGAFRSGDYATALDFLPRLRDLHVRRTGDDKSPAIAELDKAIAVAKAGGEKLTAGPGIDVTVKLDDSLRNRIQSGSTLFIFAKALSGPPMPLAVVRQPADRFPVTVHLDDSQGMVPGMTLSRFPSVIINARISRSGNPVGEKGDLEAVAVPLTQNGKAQQVDLTINQEKL